MTLNRDHPQNLHEEQDLIQKPLLKILKIVPIPKFFVHNPTFLPRNKRISSPVQQHILVSSPDSKIPFLHRFTNRKFLQLMPFAFRFSMQYIFTERAGMKVYVCLPLKSAREIDKCEYTREKRGNMHFKR
jgi:hypothetical protein